MQKLKEKAVTVAAIALGSVVIITSIITGVVFFKKEQLKSQLDKIDNGR